MNQLNSSASVSHSNHMIHTQTTYSSFEKLTLDISPLNYSTTKRVHIIDQPDFSYACNRAEYRDAFSEVLPVLASIKSSNEWITLIDCPYRPNKDAIEAAGINPSHIMLINTPTPYSPQYDHKHLIACLSNGNSAACILWKNKTPSQWEQTLLQRYCDLGDTHCFVLNNTYKKGQLTLI